MIDKTPHNSISEIVGQVKKPFVPGPGQDVTGYLIKESHFENGRSLHSDQYYFLKRYFRNAENCDKLVCVTTPSLKELKFDRDTTFVGFRGYTGLFLDRLVDSFGNNAELNYALVEESDGQLVWERKPDEPKAKLVIVLAITATCAMYFRLREFVEIYCREQSRSGSADWSKASVQTSFVSLFQLLDHTLEDEVVDFGIAASSQIHGNKLQIYSSFNWLKLDTHKIEILDGTDKWVTAYPSVRLYSNFYLPESCPLCFPELNCTKTGDIAMEQKEMPVLPTTKNHEAPNIIFGLPDFRKARRGNPKFYETFCGSKEAPKTLLKGHFEVDGSSYSHYVRGNEFFDQNRTAVLDYFNREFSRFLQKPVRKVIFVAAENKHNSTFLEEFSRESCFIGREVSILRFQPSNEFVDNFISLYSKEIVADQKHTKVVYFEEVVSSAKNFKLVSDYIKHARLEEGSASRHSALDKLGFDLVMGLIDRTARHTYDEIIKKLSSGSIKTPSKRFWSYFHLNVPIVAASHMGNPLKGKLRELQSMIGQCHLDSLKMTVGKNIGKRRARPIPELDRSDQRENELCYFPFTPLEKVSDNSREIFGLYHQWFTKERYDLLALFLTHRLNDSLADRKWKAKVEKDKKHPKKFIEALIASVLTDFDTEIAPFFIGSEPRDQDLWCKTKAVARATAEDILVKALCHPPFVYYRELYDAIFDYCQSNLAEELRKMELDGLNKFHEFRRFKFYLRRSIDLNSNFIVSRRFLVALRKETARRAAKGDPLITRYEKQIDALGKDETIPENYKVAAIKHIEYKVQQIESFWPDLLYYYKELTCRNPPAALRLEEVINSEDVLPDLVKVPRKSSLEKGIKDVYFQFTGMVKAENLFQLNELKERQKSAVQESATSIDNSIVRLESNSSDRAVRNALKLVDRSRFDTHKKKAEIRLTVERMLRAVLEIETKLSGKSSGRRTVKTNLGREIRTIIDSVVEIIRPSEWEANDISWAFFVEHRTTASASNNPNNIFTITSKETEDDPSDIRLDRRGLIYNLLYGIFDDPISRKEQTLIAALRKGDKDSFFSFKKEYFLKGSEVLTPLRKSFETLYDLDRKMNGKTRTGIPMLEDAKMSLAFRLANLAEPDKQNSRYRLTGRAVLLITTTKDSTSENFLEFMSNERVRMLLLIKEELLDYLQKQFDNDAFIDVLESRYKAIFHNSLQHGLSNYRLATKELNKRVLRSVEDADLSGRIVEDYPQNESNLGNPQFAEFKRLYSDDFTVKQNIELLDLITGAVFGQFGAVIIDPDLDNDGHQTLSGQLLVDRVVLIMSTILLGKRKFTRSDIDFSDVDLAGQFRIHKIIFDTVIMELLINMKKYCPEDGPFGLKVAFRDEQLVFENLIKKTIERPKRRRPRGLFMCEEIIKVIGGGMIMTHGKKGERFAVTLSLGRRSTEGKS